MVKIRHDDFCPCTRFHTQPEFCNCGAVEYAETQEEANRRFGEKLREINRSHGSRNRLTPQETKTP